SAVRIVDASVHAAGVEPERIGYAQLGPLFGLRVQRQQCIGIGPGGKRRIGSESRYVVLIDPVVIVEVGRNLGPLQLGTIGLIQRPAFLALAAVGLRRTVYVFALAEIETGKMAAGGQSRPDDAIAVDIHAARIEAGLGNFED